MVHDTKNYSYKFSHRPFELYIQGTQSNGVQKNQIIDKSITKPMEIRKTKYCKDCILSLKAFSATSIYNKKYAPSYRSSTLCPLSLQCNWDLTMASLWLFDDLTWCLRSWWWCRWWRWRWRCWWSFFFLVSSRFPPSFGSLQRSSSGTMYTKWPVKMSLHTWRGSSVSTTLLIAGLCLGRWLRHRYASAATFWAPFSEYCPSSLGSIIRASFRWSFSMGLAHSASFCSRWGRVLSTHFLPVRSSSSTTPKL